ncbi:putative manganese-dependent inorganic diphosphatase [Olsenella sp. HMSC062G07]|uniref:putative manganese-dependent inorganic diphosphatase n=1 Tax=Olsenella sp. HMSC062G07 TaxID=1739330 RepID=UPI0008A5D39E|nr:putative manganese-dependent inorganic diphosphatase [Olsenella sp. HMSC062G07]OFK22339.1 inorganic pyrophosphatase [Olsenella sp. HMSC062G07]
MPETIRKVNVIGHLHPDTDSICSAIALAYLKNQIDDITYEPRRAGTVNRETAFVLKHFGFEEPQLITSVRPQIKDIKIQETKGIDPEMSLFSAWTLMGDTKTDTLCITSDDCELEGLVAVKDIANANMNVFDTTIIAESRTLFANIISTLKGTMLQGDADARVTTGKVVVGTTPEMMEGKIEQGDTVLVTNRYETQRFAVESGASCLVVCNDARISNVVLDAAAANGCTVISTPYDTFAAARLISMSIPVRAIMLPADKVLRFSVNTTVDDARKTITQSRHRFFPVIDEEGSYVGLVSTPNLLNVNKKHVILVDHNERSQAVDGLEQAVIMEIVDHHRIGSIETSAPARFRNEPVGCTNTILYSMYQEEGVQIPPDIAGLMMSAILSDTLAFRSPTCTKRDEHAARELAKICGEDIDSYADAMFDAGAELSGRTAEEVFHQDFKVFSRGAARFGVGQGSFMTKNSRKAAEALVGPYLKEGAAADELPMVFYMFTDVKTSTTEMLYFGSNAEEVVKRAFGVTPENGVATLPGVVSRKKQVVPALMTTLQDSLDE